MKAILHGGSKTSGSRVPEGGHHSGASGRHLPGGAAKRWDLVQVQRALTHTRPVLTVEIDEVPRSRRPRWAGRLLPARGLRGARKGGATYNLHTLLVLSPRPLDFPTRPLCLGVFAAPSLGDDGGQDLQVSCRLEHLLFVEPAMCFNRPQLIDHSVCEQHHTRAVPSQAGVQAHSRFSFSMSGCSGTARPINSRPSL
ncbi:hypothetical protein E2C01_008628 [Portunus trituberculatus]|uniref:Uncharacterized protein n=1 Tax=Portunus trituberculatus TaxID=210409 RepID=A0A5B7D3C7_PORTR|nr:hypothetical protein [Portunus trituberculatus]